MRQAILNKTGIMITALFFAFSAQADDVVLDMTSAGAAGEALDGTAAESSYTVNGVTITGSFAAPAANPIGLNNATQFGVKSDASNNSTIDPEEAATFTLTWNAEQVGTVKLKEVVFAAFYNNDIIDVTVGSTVKSNWTYDVNDAELSTIEGATRRWTPSAPILISNGETFEIAVQAGGAAIGISIASWTLEIIDAAAASQPVMLQQWTFDQPNGTQLTGITNSVSGGATWSADKAGIEVSNNVLRAADSPANNYVNTTKDGLAQTNGQYELSWTIADADFTSPLDSTFMTYGVTLYNANNGSYYDMAGVRLAYGSGRLQLQAMNNGAWSVVYDGFGTETASNVDIRMSFDLDTDLYNVFVNNNGAGETKVGTDLVLVDGTMDALRLGGATSNFGAGNHVNVDNLTLWSIPAPAPAGDTSVLDLRNGDPGIEGDTAGDYLEDPVFAGTNGVSQGYVVFSNVMLTATGSSDTTGGVFSAYSAMGVYAPDDQYLGAPASATGWDEIEQALNESITFVPTYSTNLVSGLVLKQVHFTGVGTTGDRAIVVVQGVTNYVDSDTWVTNISLSSGDSIVFSAEDSLGLVDMTFETFAVDGGVLTPADYYNVWAAGFSLGVQNGMLDNADGDSFDNLTEYAFGGVPDNAGDNGNVPVSAVESDSGTNYLEYVYYERTNAVELGLNSTLTIGSDLVYTNWDTAGIEFVGSGTGPAGFNSVTNRIQTDQAKGFLRLQVELSD